MLMQYRPICSTFGDFGRSWAFCTFCVLVILASSTRKQPIIWNVMLVFERLSSDYEQIVFCHDESVGLRGIIAIHSTVLGPALGGTRFFNYKNEDDALEDVLRLAHGMTYKSAAAGLDLGGGKAVIIGNPAKDKTEAMLRSYARFVDSLTGRYLTAEDVGTTTDDMEIINQETPYVTGIREENGGSGDPSPVTAWGVFHGMHAVAQHLWGSESLSGKHIAISGVGKVGSALVDYVMGNGAGVTIADVNETAVNNVRTKHTVEIVPPDEIHKIACDIFSPCALGGALNETSIKELQCAAICGAANNQLAVPHAGTQIAERGILYAPDFIVNAGGVINIAEELRGYDRKRAHDRAAGIYDTTLKVLRLAADNNVTTAQAADQMAETRIAEAAQTTEHIRRFPK
jgi:glutamate dehydrogenase/leucine dehydrogenase